MFKTVARLSLLVVLLTLVACREKPPEAIWELAIDGEVTQPVTYSFQDLVDLRRAKLTDVSTRNPDEPNERTSWEGVTLFLLFKEPGGVEYSVEAWVLITLAEGTTRRVNLSDLRGALIAFKDGNGDWLADGEGAPIRLISPNQPSTEWLDGPVRITVQGQ